MSLCVVSVLLSWLQISNDIPPCVCHGGTVLLEYIYLGQIKVKIKHICKCQIKHLCFSFCLSAGNNTCFYGKCYYCRESEPACAEGEMMEGSLTLWLPDVWPLQKHRHPWGRTYREGKLAR